MCVCVYVCVCVCVYVVIGTGFSVGVNECVSMAYCSKYDIISIYVKFV